MMRWRQTIPVCCAALLALAACSPEGGVPPPREGDKVLYLDTGAIVKTLDPAQAADLSSRDMAGVLYDTLLQYDYTARPYKLIPSMLARLPETSPDGRTLSFELRDDLYFAPDQCFGSDSAAVRKVTSDDVIFSLLRIADARLNSPVYWMLRDKISGIGSFRETTAKAAPGDLAPYNKGVSGLRKLDSRRFEIVLDAPDPRFCYNLAIPYSAIVSRKACEAYANDLGEHAVGSGPFRLAEWIRDYRMIMLRNPEYRREYFPEAVNPEDRRRPLPLADRIVCRIVKQPFSSWLLFLQGELDMTALDKDNLDMVTGSGQQLSPALSGRGIELVRAPLLEVRYIGFNLNDPVLKNEKLRQAIALAYDVRRRVEYSNYQLVPANGPIPPEVPGHDPDYRNPWGSHDLEKARRLLAEAGYPGGTDPATGEALTLTFDQNGSSSSHRQLGELMVSDMAAIGIRIVPVLNNGPRFFARLRQDQMQLFRLSWVGDFPDAENFLQLFYSRNSGGSNRVGFRDPEYDRRYEATVAETDPARRTAACSSLARYVTEKSPWIFESFPISYQLRHSWLENYRPHDFAFSRWKYLSVDPEARRLRKSGFTPLDFSELRK